MRIVLDLQAMQPESRFRGIGRYSLSLAQAMARQTGPHELYVALNGLFPGTIEPLRAAFEGLIAAQNIVVWQTPGPVRGFDPANAWRHRAGELVRESFLASLRPDVVHVTSLFEGWFEDAVTSVGLCQVPAAVTLYDLIPLVHEDVYLPDARMRAWYHSKLSALKKASLLLAISEHTRREGIELLGLPAAASVNISAAADPMFRPPEHPDEVAHVPRDHGLQRPFVMYAPGGFDPRKNVDGLIHAYARLPESLRREHQIAIVSKIDAEAQERLRAVARAAGLASDELVLTGYVADAELVALYGLCSLFVHPSLHEGFGLPALEAMSCGAAVIGANATSLPEVIGREDALFDPRSTEDMAARMHKALSDTHFHAALRAHARAQAKKFSWQASARRALEAFERLHAERQEAGRRPVALPAADRLRRLADAVAQVTTSAVPSTSDWLRLAAAISENDPPGERTRQLLVDVSILARGDTRSGIQRVVRAVLQELMRNPPPGYDVQPVYCDEYSVFRYARRLATGFTHAAASGVLEDDPLETLPGDTFLGLDLSLVIVPAHLRCFERLRDRGVTLFFVVYDLLPVLRPDFFPPGSDWFSRWVNAIAGAGDGAVCISRAVADALVSWLETAHVERQRQLDIGYFHLGADIAASVPTGGLPEDAESILAETAKRPCLLMVGTIEPRKGHAQTLAAFERLWADGVDVGLVIVGKQGWMVEPLAARARGHAELGTRLLWPEDVSDEMLLKLYDSAAALLAPSEGEGFGLPLVEAAQHGLPIIARDLPAFREVAGEHAFYFSGNTADDLAAAISAWLCLSECGNIPASGDMPWLTWAQSTAQLLDVILNGRWYTHWPGSPEK